MGIWCRREESGIRATARKTFYLVYFIVFQVYLVTSVFLVDDKNESTFLIEIEIIYLVVMVKAIYLLWKNKEISEFLYYPMNAHSDEFSIEFRKYFEHGNKMETLMKFVHVYMPMVLVADAFVCFSPIFYTKRMLPFFVVYSLNIKYSDALYYVMYAYIMLALIFAFVFNLTSVLIWYITINYSIVYEVLGNQLRKLGVNGDKNQERSLYLQNLISAINVHRKVFEYDIFDQHK